MQLYADCLLLGAQHPSKGCRAEVHRNKRRYLCDLRHHRTRHLRRDPAEQEGVYFVGHCKRNRRYRHRHCTGENVCAGRYGHHRIFEFRFRGRQQYAADVCSSRRLRRDGRRLYPDFCTQQEHWAACGAAGGDRCAVRGCGQRGKGSLCAGLWFSACPRHLHG